MMRELRVRTVKELVKMRDGKVSPEWKDMIDFVISQKRDWGKEMRERRAEGREQNYSDKISEAFAHMDWMGYGDDEFVE